MSLVAHQAHFVYNSSPYGLLNFAPFRPALWGIVDSLQIPGALLHRKLWLLAKTGAQSGSFWLQICQERVEPQMIFQWSQLDGFLKMPYTGIEALSPNSTLIKLAFCHNPSTAGIGTYDWSMIGEYGEDGAFAGSTMTMGFGAGYHYQLKPSYEQYGCAHMPMLEFFARAETLILWWNDGQSGIHDLDWFWACQSQSMSPNFIAESYQNLIA